MKYLLFTGVMLVAGHCQAQQVFRCVEGKTVSYQSAPCATPQAKPKVWDATPEPPPTNDELWRRYHAKKKGERESAYLRQLAGREGLVNGQSQPIGARIPIQGGSACVAAKQHREAMLEAVGMNRNHDLLRRLDDAVYRACK
ncbi:MAG TPA: DUF4124 domain-containing protein [Pseudoxanthomonas sp.]